MKGRREPSGVTDARAPPAPDGWSARSASRRGLTDRRVAAGCAGISSTGSLVDWANGSGLAGRLGAGSAGTVGAGSAGTVGAGPAGTVGAGPAGRLRRFADGNAAGGGPAGIGVAWCAYPTAVGSSEGDPPACGRP
jgi:hypothetical protein